MRVKFRYFTIAVRWGSCAVLFLLRIRLRKESEEFALSVRVAYSGHDVEDFDLSDMFSSYFEANKLVQVISVERETSGSVLETRPQWRRSSRNQHLD